MNIQNAKLKKWQNAAKEVEKITDALGRPIDDGIKELVTALCVLGFPTYDSCEGHFQRRVERKAPVTICPRVGVQFPYPRGFEPRIFYKKASKTVIRSYKKKNVQLWQKMFRLLDAFYKDRHVPSDVRLILGTCSAFGCFDLTNQGFRVLSTFPSRTRLRTYQKEMRAFKDFLKDRILRPA